MTERQGASSALRPGTLVGEYEVTHLLGEGGMGVVYAGTHPEIGKRVAIKVLAPHAAQHADLIRRFKEEARAVNRIRHPNIIDIFAFNQLPDGRHYFVMEYLEGESLAARLERGSLELRETRRLLAQICRALEAAHGAGVVHRDLKPDNIWVAAQQGSESRIKLLDFGIAKLSDLAKVNATQTGVSMGTPHYMAPEQGMGRAVDHRADIYALGVVLYQIFAGRLPFEGVNAHEIVFRHVTETPKPPSAHRPIVPAAMERIILECLEKDPERRPSSMAALGARIESAFAEGGGFQARPGATLPLPAPPAHPQVPAPGGTALLSEAGRIPGMLAAQPPSSTTLRGSTGERVATGGDIGASELESAGRRGWRRPAAGIAAVAVAAIAVGIGVLGRSSAPPSAAHPAAGGALTPGPLPPPPPAAPPPPAEPAPAPDRSGPAPTPRAVAAAPPEPLQATPPRAPRSELKRKPAARPTVSRAGGKAKPDGEPGLATSPAPQKPAAAKPDCTTKFTLDAQGDKHFKPECF